MREIMQKLSLFAVPVVLAATGCASSENKADASTDSSDDSITDPGDISLNTECPNSIDPIVPFGTVQKVGDGSALSCTEAALNEALKIVGATEEGGSILFDCGSSPHTIVLTKSLFIDFPVLIDGENTVTLSGDKKVRVIDLDHYAELILQRITIRDGLTETSGAGIHHPWYGILKAIEVTFKNNHCTGKQGEIGGGAVFAGGLSEAVFSNCRFIGNSASNGGGILNRGSNLVIVNSTFYGNQAVSSASEGQYGNGGGLYIDGMVYEGDGEPKDFYMCGTVFENNKANQHGSAVFSYFYEGTASFIDQCLFKANNFRDSPTGGSGGLYHEGVPLLLTNSAFQENTSEAHAAALFIGSGSTAEVINCTFASNRVPEVGAAIFSGASPVNITNCTFFGNDADYAPSIFKGTSASITLKNNIFAYNTSPNQYSALNCHETFNDQGGNLQWPDKRPSGNDDNPCTETVIFADPILSQISDNGGSTPTMAVAENSPARNAATSCPEVDQRGKERDEPCDIGAYEFIETF